MEAPLIGRDYMPVSVLSTMVLGIGVDFAIHFVERYRAPMSSIVGLSWPSSIVVLPALASVGTGR